MKEEPLSIWASSDFLLWYSQAWKNTKKDVSSSSGTHSRNAPSPFSFLQASHEPLFLTRLSEWSDHLSHCTYLWEQRATSQICWPQLLSVRFAFWCQWRIGSCPPQYFWVKLRFRSPEYLSQGSTKKTAVWITESKSFPQADDCHQAYLSWHSIDRQIEPVQSLATCSRNRCVTVRQTLSLLTSFIGSPTLKLRRQVVSAHLQMLGFGCLWISPRQQSNLQIL